MANRSGISRLAKVSCCWAALYKDGRLYFGADNGQADASPGTWESTSGWPIGLKKEELFQAAGATLNRLPAQNTHKTPPIHRQAELPGKVGRAGMGGSFMGRTQTGRWVEKPTAVPPICIVV